LASPRPEGPSSGLRLFPSLFSVPFSDPTRSNLDVTIIASAVDLPLTATAGFYRVLQSMVRRRLRNFHSYLLINYQFITN
jgi:hypothetical protein